MSGESGVQSLDVVWTWLVTHVINNRRCVLTQLGIEHWYFMICLNSMIYQKKKKKIIWYRIAIFWSICQYQQCKSLKRNETATLTHSLCRTMTCSIYRHGLNGTLSTGRVKAGPTDFDICIQTCSSSGRCPNNSRVAVHGLDTMISQEYHKQGSTVRVFHSHLLLLWYDWTRQSLTNLMITRRKYTTKQNRSFLLGWQESQTSKCSSCFSATWRGCWTQTLLLAVKVLLCFPNHKDLNPGSNYVFLPNVSGKVNLSYITVVCRRSLRLFFPRSCPHLSLKSPPCLCSSFLPPLLYSIIAAPLSSPVALFSSLPPRPPPLCSL